MSLPSIALVEDETILREELTFQLSQLGFAIESFADASQLYRRLAVHRFAVVILDIGLSGEDGLSIGSHLRRHDKRIGIVFVTARAQREDKLIGLRAGADAYLSKPVDIDELVLALQRLIERDNDAGAVPDTALSLTAGTTWRLDHGGDFLLSPLSKRVRLTVNEMRLLRLLLDKPGEVAVAPALATALGQLPEDYDKHRVEVIISRLRDKVLRETGSVLPVMARRGVGYVFQPASD